MKGSKFKDAVFEQFARMAYAFSSPKRLELIDVLTQSYLHDRNTMESISLLDLKRWIEDEKVIVIDVRPVEEFRQAHKKGALSIPLAELKNRLQEIPNNIDIVAYCRGPYCVLAPEAVAILGTAGYHVLRLEEGLPEWRNAGLPVDAETFISQE